MTVKEIRSGESENIEFKAELPAKSIKYMKSVVAFSNGNGGRIVFGVEDGTWNVVGIPKEKIFEVKDSITNAIADSCEPMIFPDIYFQDMNDKTVIVVDIESGKQKPYFIKSMGIKDGTFVRTSGTSRVAESYKLQELLLEGKNESFDQLPAQNQSLTEEEINALCHEMTEIARKNSKTEEARANVRPVTKNKLINWGLLIEKGHKLIPSNGFCLLTGRDLPGIVVQTQCGVFKGSTRSVFVDRKTYTGPIHHQIDEAYNFVLRSMRMGAKIEGLYREDVYELPLRTVREMISNAICHRSYLEPSNVQVAFYDNRLEVTSPGMLLGGVTIAKMREGYSKVRNAGIAAAFAYMKIIEQWGSGIPRMFDDCKEYGLQEPELIDLDGDFRVNLYRIPLEQIQSAEASETADKSADKSADSADKSADSADKSADSADKSVDAKNGAEEKLSDRQIQILELMEPETLYSTQEIADKLGIKAPRTRQLLGELVELKKLDTTAATRNRRYKKR